MGRAYDSAQAYMAKIPGAGKGQRNAEAFRLSALLQKDFNLFQDEAWSLLTQWAAKCDPPIDSEELAQCLQNGARYGSMPNGTKGNLSRDLPPPAAQQSAFQDWGSEPEADEAPVLEFESGSQVVNLLRSGDSFMPAHRRGRFVKFGLPVIDQMCCTARGELGIVAAGTGVGKSTLATQALMATARHGHKAALVSLEMIREQVLARIGSHVTGVSHSDLFEKGSGGVIPSTSDEKLLDNVFFLCGMSGFNFTDMRRSIEVAVKKHGVSSVWIDYFTLVQPPNLSRQTGSAQVYADLSKAFKRMAQELDISVVILAQFNRTFQGAGEKPTMFNLKETSQLEQDASWVLVMWEDAQKHHWASLDKNRMGKSGIKVPIVFDHACQRIREGEPETRETFAVPEFRY